MELNFFGRQRLDYIKKYRPGYYTEMGMQGKLREHLQTLQTQAEDRWELLIEQNQESWGVTEELKASDPVKWIGLMTNLRETMREQVLNEMIYN